MDRKSLIFLLFIFFFISLLLYWTVFLTQPNPGNGGKEGNEGENEVNLDIDETQFFQVPEYPLGTILALIACLVALGVYSKSRKFTNSKIPKFEKL